MNNTFWIASSGMTVLFASFNEMDAFEVYQEKKNNTELPYLDMYEDSLDNWMPLDNNQYQHTKTPNQIEMHG